jgi:cell division protein FtsN
MVIDYHERKQVSKNRPKKPAVNFVFIFVAAIIIAIYSLGVATGWFLYKLRKNNPAGAPVNVAAVSNQKTGDASPPTALQQGSKDKTGDPPLTFYDALPKGEVTALGSGLNPAPVDRRPATANLNKTTGNALPANQEEELNRQTISSAQNNKKHERSTSSTPLVGSADKNSTVADKSDMLPVSNKPVSSSKKYTVQAASCSVKKDAEAVKESLDRKGLLSYVVESKIQGKGTWYRVRLGNHLDLETANKIAAKVGKSAILIPE